MCVQKLDYHYQGDVSQIVFFKMPKILFMGDEFKEVSTSAKLLYMLLLDRVSISDKNNWIDKNDKIFIYYTQAEAMAQLEFGNKKVSNLFKELENFGLIQRIKQGYSKPDIIYVKSLSSIQVEDTSFAGEYKYGRPNIEHRIDEKSEEVIRLELKVKELERELKIVKQQVKENEFSENSSVENSNCYAECTVENLDLGNMTCQNNISKDVKTTTHDMSKQQPNKNNFKNNNLNNNNSFIQQENEKKGMNERMINQQFKLNVINEMYETKQLPYCYTDSEIKMNVAIKELVNYDTTQSKYKNNKVDEVYFSTFKLFTKALIEMLTSKMNMLLNQQRVTYSKVYEKLNEYISFSEDENGQQYCHLNKLVDNAINDYQRGNSNTEIKYPKKYMQACIWNALEQGDVRVQYVKVVKAEETKPLPNTSYDLALADEMLNEVPRLV